MSVASELLQLLKQAVKRFGRAGLEGFAEENGITGSSFKETLHNVAHELEDWDAEMLGHILILCGDEEDDIEESIGDWAAELDVDQDGAEDFIDLSAAIVEKLAPQLSQARIAQPIYDDEEFLDPSSLYDKKAAGDDLYDFQKECLKDLRKTMDGARPGSKHVLEVATGGGKTRIANDWLAKHILPAGKRVLWVTKDWELLRQAITDLCRRHVVGGDTVGRFGDARKLPGLPDDDRAQVVYTTIYTWHAAKRVPALDPGDLIVIDEQHWGESGRMYRELTRFYGKDVTFLGLTATPRPWTEYKPVGKRYDFFELQRQSPQVLARPLVDAPVRTEVDWSGRLNSANGDYNKTSLGELARSSKRNAKILATYRNKDQEFGKTLVFACDTGHADELAKLFQRDGYSAEALHSDVKPPEERRNRLERFRNSETKILVNVEMLTHGVDIPDIQTVFLCRPTASTALFWQMIGRGSRIVRDQHQNIVKGEFRIVDFVDNVPKHSDPDKALTAEKHITPGIAPRRSPQRPKQRLVHEFAPAEMRFCTGEHPYEGLAGIEYQSEQTFGIEFEFTRADFEGEKPSDWNRVASSLLDAIRGTLGSKFVGNKPLSVYGASRDYRVWNVEYDGSCGWEVVSRILQGKEGLEEVADVLAQLEDSTQALGLRLDYRTGTHVHLAWKVDLRNLRRLLAMVTFFEPALYSLVSPSRAENDYCAPLRSVFDEMDGLRTLEEWKEALEDHDMRYFTVNLRNVFGDTGTVEVRMHNGTQEPRKILVWMSLWMRILKIAEGVREIPRGSSDTDALPLSHGPEGDIMALANLVSVDKELREALLERRQFVMDNSWAAVPKFRDLAEELLMEWSPARQRQS